MNFNANCNGGKNNDVILKRFNEKISPKDYIKFDIPLEEELDRNKQKTGRMLDPEPEKFLYGDEYYYAKFIYGIMASDEETDNKIKEFIAAKDDLLSKIIESLCLEI